MNTRKSFGLQFQHEMASRSFALTQDGGRLVAASNGRVFMLSNLGTALWEYELEHYSPLDVFITPDGSRAAVTVEYDVELYMLDSRGRLLWQFSEGTEEVWAIAMTPDGDRVAAVSDRLYMLDGGGELLWEYEAEDGLVGDVAISQDGSQVVIGDWDGHVHMLDGRGSLLWRFDGVREFGSVVMTPSGNRVAVVGRRQTDLHMLDRSGELVWKYGGVDGARSIAMTPDGERVAVASYDKGQLEMLDGRGELLWNFAPIGWVRSLAISPDGTRVAVVGYEDGELSVLNGDGQLMWKRESVGRLPSLPEHQHWSLEWTRDRSGLAMGAWGGSLYLFKEGASDRRTIEPAVPNPGPRTDAVDRIRCWIGLHRGWWEYQSRSECEQILLRPDHGSTRSRVHHRWTRSNETYDKDFDNVDEVMESIEERKPTTMYYRCRRCHETNTETDLDPEDYG